MRLVVALICKRNYSRIDAHELVNDFFSEYNYQIDYFAMREILSLAVKEGFVSKDRNRRFFHPTEKVNAFAQIESDITRSQSELDCLIIEFQRFSQENKVPYSIDVAKDIVVAYVKKQKIEHITGHIEAPLNDKRIDYLFGRFVYYIRENKPELFSYLNNIVVGSILSDCLTYHEKINKTANLGNLTVVLDTAIVFMALGIDVADRSEFYTNLIKDLQRKGAHTAIFRHTYDEMEYVLSGAETWIGDPYYDPSKASDTAEYFRSINATKNDIIDYRLKLKSNIEKLGLSFIDPEYQESKYNRVEDEQEIYSRIVAKYKETNCYFNESIQKYTIERDASSIIKTYLLRNTRQPMNLVDSHAIFVTANQTLARVASEYHYSSGRAEKSIPSTVTDTFLGTYLWLSDPVKVSEMSEKQILYNAYLAFQPNRLLVQKLTASINEMLMAGNISPEDCYALKGDKLVLEKLAQKTLGDPDAYTEVTASSIISDIQREAEERGASLMREIDEKRIAAQQRQNTILRTDLVKHLETAVRDKQNELDMQECRLKEVTISTMHFRKAIKTAFVILLLLVCIAIAYTIVTSETVYTIISAIVPVVLWITSAVGLKVMKPTDILEHLSNKWQLYQCKKKGCSEHEVKLIKEQIDSLNDQIQTHKNSLSA